MSSDRHDIESPAPSSDGDAGIHGSEPAGLHGASGRGHVPGTGPSLNAAASYRFIRKDGGLPGAIVRPESKVLTGADLNQKSSHLARVKSDDLGLNICLEVNSVDTESFAVTQL